jgi:hypothetical protein
MQYKEKFITTVYIMNYLSFDVGINNLAFCLLSHDDTSVKINKWGIISLSDNKKQCVVCEKNAQYTIPSTNKFYCKLHSKQHVCADLLTTKCSNNERCKHVIARTNNECGKKAKTIVDSISYCANHLKTKISQHKKLNTVQKISKISAYKIPPQNLATKLFEVLDTYTDFLKVKEVLIENQPTLMNPTMKTISSLLFSYFVLRGITEKTKTGSSIDNVKFVCPSNKLKVSKKISEKLASVKASEKYKLTKEYGKKFCKEIIKNDKTNLDFLNGQKKQDDLCDAFLQGYYYVIGKNIPNDVIEIMDNLV